MCAVTVALVSLNQLSTFWLAVSVIVLTCKCAHTKECTLYGMLLHWVLKIVFQHAPLSPSLSHFASCHDGTHQCSHTIDSLSHFPSSSTCLSLSFGAIFVNCSRTHGYMHWRKDDEHSQKKTLQTQSLMGNSFLLQCTLARTLMHTLF